MSIIPQVSYSTTHTAAKFRKCDSRNLNLTPFCQLITSDGRPKRWLADLLQAYAKGQTPLYLEGDGGQRAEYPGSMAEDELLEGLKRENSTYDAFARDIAVLNIYFGEPEFQGKSL